MGKYVRFKNGVDSMLALPKLLLDEGDSTAPRGQDTREIRNLLIEIDDPTDVTMLGIGRNWNMRIAVAEFLQLVGGFSDPDLMARVSPTFKKFMNGGSLSGAYGPRLSMQMGTAIERLIADPDTRQSVVTIWDPLHDLMQEDRKDIPCTLSLTFAIRNGKLLMSTHMRSNDVWWGWSYDLFQFTQLQCTVANMLDLDPGPYIHYADSFHLYDRDLSAVDQLHEPDHEEVKSDGQVLRKLEVVPRPRLSGIGWHAENKNWRRVQELAHDLLYFGSDENDMTVTEGWMSEVMSHVR